MPRPTLSVVIPNYNDSEFLGDTVGAILQQSWPPDEVVVVDDGSTDSSVELVRALQEAHPSVTLIQNQRNLGVIGAAHVGFAASRGDYLCFAAADDLLLPGFFEAAMNLLIEHPEACGCHGRFADASPDGRPSVPAFTRIRLDSARYYSPAEVVQFIRDGWAAGFLGTILSRSSLESVGILSEDLRWYSDWFAMLALALRHGICLLPNQVAVRRPSPASYSSRASGPEWKVPLYNILHRLDSADYADVRAGFLAGALYTLGWPMFTILMRPSNWHYVSGDYLRLRLRVLLGGMTPEFLLAWNRSRRTKHQGT